MRRISNNRAVYALISVALSFTSAACSSDTPDPALAATAALSAMTSPRSAGGLDRSATVRGIDADANGIRDDIDALLVGRFRDQGQRSAAAQAARAFQASLTVDTNDKSATSAVSRAQMNAINCLFEKFVEGQNAPPPPGATTASSLSREIEAMTTNTKQRLQAYLKFNKAMDGTTSSIPRESTCE